MVRVSNCVRLVKSRPSEEEEVLTGLSSSVQTQHQDAHFLRAKDLPHHLRYLTTHLGDTSIGFEKRIKRYVWRHKKAYHEETRRKGEE